MRRQGLKNPLPLFSNAVITAIVIVPMAVSGAPFWACWGLGWAVWLALICQDWVRARSRP